MTNAYNFTAYGSVRENLPDTPQVDGNTGAIRLAKYLEQFVEQDSLISAARAGELYLMENATISTGIAQTANTTQDTTKPFITGSVPTSSKKSFELLHLLMKPTAVSSGQTIQHIDIITCQGVPWASAGTDYNSNQSGIANAGYRNLRTGVNRQSILSTLRVGVPVTALGGDPRVVAHFTPRKTTIPVVGDEYHMIFKAAGGDFGARQTVVDPVSTTVNIYTREFAPFVVDPGTGFMIIPWAPSIGGAMSWEFAALWRER